MKASIGNKSLAARIWCATFLSFGIGCFAFAIISNNNPEPFILAACTIFSAIGSLPAFIILIFSLKGIEKMQLTSTEKIAVQVLVNLLISILYGAVGIMITSGLDGIINWERVASEFLQFSGILFGCTCSAILINIPSLRRYFTNSQIKINYKMENNEQLPEQRQHENRTPNKRNSVLIKAAMVAGLTLIMLIPMAFIQSLINEREVRHQEVVKEVSNKWASAQIISNPYLVIPYNTTFTDSQNKVTHLTKNLILLPETVKMNGKLFPEERKRSIYNVLLYKSDINIQGSFLLSRITKTIKSEDLRLSEARICLGVTDFKGIEEKINCSYNNAAVTLVPGLPASAIDSGGLSAPVQLTADALTQTASFSVNMKIKGSEQLQFVPLSGNSDYTLESLWPNPSFNGNTLPAERQVNKDGFKAKWTYNQANLPFDLVLEKENTINKRDFAFGVSMVQPADDYAQTMRSAKYAILIIGLTFALSFITELMQNKPVHPVQYGLVGIALTIFYTLLLSISEFIRFDLSYLISAGATILLIAFYVQSHFRNWKAGAAFAFILSMLYGFIYILIRLEDTALLVGSIGLFIMLALIMYATRKVNWYDPTITSLDTVNV